VQTSSRLAFMLATIPVKKQQKNASQKRRGRPPTGRGKTIGVRIHDDRLAAIDAWIARQPDPKPTRPEAIRRLFEKALR
jgi:hypothetical protein